MDNLMFTEKSLVYTKQ